MILVLEEHNILQMHCIITMYDQSHDIPPAEILILYLFQTLTKLELFANHVGNQGVEHLAHALQRNRVQLISQFCSFYRIDIFSFLIDAHDTWFTKKQY